MVFWFPTSPPSAKAQALSQLVAQVVRAEQAKDPTLEPHEVQQALALARQHVGSGVSAAKARALALGAALAAALLGLALALVR